MPAAHLRAELIAVCVTLLIPHTLLMNCVCAWSGLNAHTLVLLSDIDRNEPLRRAFYDGPAGTAISVSIEGRNVAAAIAASGDGDRSAEKRDSGFIIASRAAPLADATASPLLYDGGSGRANVPVRTVLSDEWVVLEKPARHRRHVSHSNDEGTLFLHCRLPVAHSAAYVAAREAAFLRLHGPRMQDRLRAWWHALALSRHSGCLYGDAEAPGTGVARFYELCPEEAVYRIRPSRALLERISAMTEDDAAEMRDDQFAGLHDLFRRLASQMEKGIRQRKATSGRGREDRRKRLMDWMTRLHQSRRQHHAVHADASYAGTFERVGEHHAILSQPRWSWLPRAWEMTYPSRTPCHEHFTTVGREATPLRNGNVTANAVSETAEEEHPSAISPAGAYWKTRIRLRCPAAASKLSQKHHGRLDEMPTHWSFTEMRQLCEYHVDLVTPLVCGWEHELDSIRVNPIACVALS